MWNIGLDEAQAEIKITERNINNLRYADDTILMAESEEELKTFFMKVKKQQLEPDIEQWADSKLGKEYIKAVYCHPAYLTSMQSTSWETLGWKKHKLETRLPGEISITPDMQMTPPLWQKVKRN